MSAETRLDDLDVKQRDGRVGKGYSRFVKAMRYILPFIAAAMIVVVVSWLEMDNKMAVINKDDLIPQSQNDIGENELLNPHFSSTDAQNQPISVTAASALQNQENSDLIKLDTPNADLKMKDGSDINIKALSGVYEQNSEKLFLQNNVVIRHQSGYELQGEEMRIDMKSRQAFSDQDVQIIGPDAKINAVGLDGDMGAGVLIFKGPATLTLYPKGTKKKNEEQSNE